MIDLFSGKEKERHKMPKNYY